MGTRSREWARAMGRGNGAGEWVRTMARGNGGAEWVAGMGGGDGRAGWTSGMGASKVVPVPKTPDTVLEIRDRLRLNLAAAFKRARAEAELTQAQLATHLGVSEASVSCVEAGKQLITLERLLLFCDLFGHEPNEVLLGRQS